MGGGVIIMIRSGEMCWGCVGLGAAQGCNREQNTHSAMPLLIALTILYFPLPSGTLSPRRGEAPSFPFPSFLDDPQPCC